MVDQTIKDIRAHFAPLVGERIIRYETAELLLTDGSWSDWPDLPIRIYTDGGKLISLSWSRIDDPWIADDLSLPFSIEDSTVRWISNGIDKINPAVGATIRSVMLGQGGMSIEGREVEIWTRLLIQIDDRWLAIFNAGDENGYGFHADWPPGECVMCV